MGRAEVYHHSFSTGVMDKTVLPRTDLQVMQLAAEDQTNLLCMTTGKGFMRPGFGYLGSTPSNTPARLLPFIFSADDACLIELTAYSMRFWVGDQLVSRAAVTSAIASGDFSSGAGWTDASTAGATAAPSGGYLVLAAPAKGSRAIYKQQVTTSSAGVEHGLFVIVERGPVMFRVGSTDGGDEYLAETELKTGRHSLAFTPTGSYWVQFDSSDPVARRVFSIAVEGAGVVTLPTFWGNDDLINIRHAQSADVVFVACRGQKQKRIERRGLRGAGRSWSVVDYDSNSGPLTSGRTSRARLKPTLTEGNTTLTADKAFFKPSHQGALFKLNHTGQMVVQKLAGAGQFTDPIEVTGINNSAATAPEDVFDDRAWGYVITGTWVGSLRVYRSFDGPDFGYKEYRADSGAATIPITANGSGTNTDTDDNAVVWYRIGFEEGSYTSGTAEIAIEYAGGGGSGVCRVIEVASPTSASIEVLSPFKGTTYSDDWQEGQWSPYQGYPSACGLFEGRLWWSGADRFWGSVSDDFENFDEDVEGDSGPINRVVATDGVNDVQWIMPLQRLVLGTEGTETTARSSSFDEPLTPTNTTLKDASTVGSASVSPLRVDGRGIFVSRSGNELYELSINLDSADYAASKLTELVKSWFGSSIVSLAAQRHPDTRVWVAMADGSAMCCVYEPAQKVTAFIPIETSGTFEGFAVLPGTTQDILYAIIARTVGGSTVRFIERMALDTESAPGTYCKVADSYITYNLGAPVLQVPVPHLIGSEVVVWADGAPVTDTDANGMTVAKTFTVDGSGNIDLPEALESIVVGLAYDWRYKSARLAYGASGGTSMLKDKRVSELGLVMTDYARAGIRYGGTFDETVRPMLPLPIMRGGVTAPAVVSSQVDDESDFILNDGFSLDSRICLRGSSPFPASLLGMTMTVTTNA